MRILGHQKTPDEATSPGLDGHILPLTGRKAEPYPEDFTSGGFESGADGNSRYLPAGQAVDRSFGATEQPPADSTGDLMPKPARPMQRWID